jgi:hypothetical protein
MAQLLQLAAPATSLCLGNDESFCLIAVRVRGSEAVSGGCAGRAPSTPGHATPRPRQGAAMSGGSLSPEGLEFLAKHVDSAEQLDILLLLHREPDRQWKALDVSQAIYTVPASATMRLESLVATGLVESSGGSDPGYTYQPSSDRLRKQVDDLAAAYAVDRVAVIKLIFARPPDPVESFSDAFRIRGKRE